MATVGPGLLRMVIEVLAESAASAICRNVYRNAVVSGFRCLLLFRERPVRTTGRAATGGNRDADTTTTMMTLAHHATTHAFAGTLLQIYPFRGASRHLGHRRQPQTPPVIIRTSRHRHRPR